MKKDIIVTAKTVEDAAQNGAAQLGVSREDVEIEVLEEPKKGFLGIGSSDAKIVVRYALSIKEATDDFLQTSCQAYPWKSFLPHKNGLL